MSTHGPVQEAYRDKLNELAKFLDEALNGPRGKGSPPRSVGFALLMFPLGGDPGNRINYIGNSDRNDMLVALKELVARWEGMDINHPSTRQ